MRLMRNAGVGLVAGTLGTAAMDLVLYQRYRRSGGTSGFWRWEFASDVTGWENASAPGQLGRKALKLATGHEPSPEWARAATNIMHWATGVGMGRAIRCGGKFRVDSPVGAGGRVWACGVAVRLRRAPVGEGVQADLGLRRTDTSRRSVRAHRVWHRRKCGLRRTDEGGTISGAQTKPLPATRHRASRRAHR